MAKSLKSKWKRKMRAIKRVRYGEKELERLEKMLANHEDTESVEIVNPKKLTKNENDSKESNNQGTKEGEQSMEVDKPKRSSRTLMDEHGAFPIWLHPRKRKLISKRLKKQKKKKAKSK